MNQAYATALPPAIDLKSPFFAHSILLENTSTARGGLLRNRCLRRFPSRNCRRRNLHTLFPSGTIVSAFSTNSVAILYGGLVTMCPFHSILYMERKSYCSFPHLSTMSDDRTVSPCRSSTLDRCFSPQAHSQTCLSNVSFCSRSSAASGLVA